MDGANLVPSVWKLAAGQLTLFPLPGSMPSVSALDLYRAIWRDEPDNFQRQPAPLGPTLANGRRKDVMVGCTVQPLRVDLALNPVQSGLIHPGDSLPVFGGADEVRGEFEKIFDALNSGRIGGAYNRIALRVQFRAQASTNADANNILVASLPERYRLQLRDEEDFVLQVNSPYRNESAGNLAVNRVNRWSVDRVQVLTVAVPIGPAQVAPAASGAPEGPQVNTFTTAALFFEENNAPSVAALSGGQLVQLGREGLKHAMESGRELGLSI